MIGFRELGLSISLDLLRIWIFHYLSKHLHLLKYLVLFLIKKYSSHHKQICLIYWDSIVLMEVISCGMMNHYYVASKMEELLLLSIWIWLSSKLYKVSIAYSIIEVHYLLYNSIVFSTKLLILSQLLYLETRLDKEEKDFLIVSWIDL